VGKKFEKTLKNEVNRKGKAPEISIKKKKKVTSPSRAGELESRGRTPEVK